MLGLDSAVATPDMSEYSLRISRSEGFFVYQDVQAQSLWSGLGLHESLCSLSAPAPSGTTRNVTD